MDIPLYTEIKLFAFLFKESYSLDELFSSVPIARYYGESTNFEIDTTTSSLSLGITLLDSPDADSTAPTIAEVTAVTTPTTDSTPDYIFSSDEAGTISYGGSCSSSTISAISGDNTITLLSLSDGTYSDCTINVTDDSENVSNTLTITSFEIDSSSATLAEVTAVSTPTNDSTPSYTFSSDEAGTISYGGSCSSTTLTAIAGNNSITLSSLSDGTYSDCTISVDDISGNTTTITMSSFTVDTTSPTLVEVTAVSTPTSDSTPSYTFSSDEAGTISYGGSCSSSTSAAIASDNTITLSSLSDGTYSDCTINVTDTAGNISSTLTITSFTVSTSSTSQMGGAIQGTELSLSTEVTTLAGTGSAGSTNGTGTEASFYRPYAITTDGTKLYISDSVNHLIRQIVISTGEVTTLAGTGSAGSTNGTGTAASFNLPKGITTDGTNLYLADFSNHLIRQIVISTGVVTTLAGSGTAGSEDGTGTQATFFNPKGITADELSLIHISEPTRPY